MKPGYSLSIRIFVRGCPRRVFPAPAGEADMGILKVTAAITEVGIMAGPVMDTAVMAGDTGIVVVGSC